MVLSVSVLGSSTLRYPLCFSSYSKNTKKITSSLSLVTSKPQQQQQQQRQHKHLCSLGLVNRSYTQMKKTRSRSGGFVCYSAPLSPENLQWVCTVSAAVLMVVKGTAVQKSLLVPLFALQAPTSIFSWIKGEYGAWTAFFALLVRLFYMIPGELELPFIAMLLVIVSPYQVTNLRGTQAGVIISLVIAAYLAFQHFSKLGSFQRAFDQGSVVATLAVAGITAVPCLLLI